MAVSHDVAAADVESREYKDCSEAVTCPICLDHLVDARRLACSHTFCLQCLIAYRRTKDSVTCPKCRQPTVPKCYLLTELPANTFVNQVSSLLGTYEILATGNVYSYSNVWVPCD